MNTTVCVTGATAGIGKATAVLLAKHNYDLILTGRRQNLLDGIKKEITMQYNVRVLCLAFDVRNNKEVQNAISGLSDEWNTIDILINNAGLAAGLTPINEGVLDDWERMIDTNIKGLLYITRAISPMMVKRERGHIINISSISGKELYENGNVYCGTKHAVEGITKGMRIDLMKHNIKVSTISPGMVNTEFSTVRFHGDKKRADKVYENWIPLYAEDVAEAILFAITRPPHVNVNDILIMPTDQANAVYINKKNKE